MNAVIWPLEGAEYFREERSLESEVKQADDANIATNCKKFDQLLQLLEICDRYLKLFKL